MAIRTAFLASVACLPFAAYSQSIDKHRPPQEPTVIRGVRGWMPIGRPPPPLDWGSSELDEIVLRDAREAIVPFDDALPDFGGRREISRHSKQGSADWQFLDKVESTRYKKNGKLSYGKPSFTPSDGKDREKMIAELEEVSAKSFEAALGSILSPSANVQLQRDSSAIFSWPVRIYKFKVAQTDSQWCVESPDRLKYCPAYSGTVTIDLPTHKVIRIEQKATDLPEYFPLASVELRYTFGLLNDRINMVYVPSFAENLACFRESGVCDRKVTQLSYDEP